MLYQMIYTSMSISDLSRERLADLMVEARERNVAHDVTGMLVYQRRTFLQFLEGPRAAVEHIFNDKIRHDHRHTAIIVFYEGLADERTFGSWSMACYRFGDEELEIGGFRSLDEAIEQGAFVNMSGSEAVDLLLSIHDSGRGQAV